MNQVTERTFVVEVLASTTPVLVVYGAAWCGPCRQLEQQLPALVRALENRCPGLTAVKVDIGTDAQVPGASAIKSIPTLILYAQGEAKARHVGVPSLQQLEEMLRAL